MDSQTLGILLMFLGLPLILSIPITALIWGAHQRKLEAMRLEYPTDGRDIRSRLDALEKRVQQVEQKQANVEPKR